MKPTDETMAVLRAYGTLPTALAGEIVERECEIKALRMALAIAFSCVLVLAVLLVAAALVNCGVLP